MNETDFGIILGSQPYRDFDGLVYVLLKKYGVRTFLYRGLYKPNSELLSRAQLYQIYEFLFNYKESGLLIPKSITLKENFIHLQNDAYKQILAAVLFELRAILDQEYDLVASFLSNLDQKDQAILVFLIFLSELLNHNGLQPMVDFDVHHRQQKVASFSIEEGGFVVYNYNNSYSKEELQQIRRIFKANFDVIDKLMDMEISGQVVQTIIDYFRFHMQLGLNSWEIYKEIVYN